MRISYTPKARRDLEKILEFYEDIRQLKKGRKIRAKLILTGAKLRDFPELGKKDEYFSIKYQQVCRSLIWDNYKIIYVIKAEEEKVSVLRFYDNRRGIGV